MPTRTLFASVIALAGFASPALAFHPNGGSTHFFGLTWGRSPSGNVPQSFGVVPQSFGVVPQSFGMVPQSFGMVPQSFGVFPQSFGMVPQSFGVFPQSFGMVPQSFGVIQNPNVSNNGTASGLLPTDILTLLQNACRVVNPGGGSTGISADDVAKLKKDLDAIKSNQATILAELKQMRLKLEIPENVPAEPTPKKGKENKSNTSGSIVPVAPALASIDEKLTDLAASRKLLDAQRAAVKAPVPSGKAIAGN